MAKKLTDQLRKHVLSAEQSRYRISKDTGISQSALSLFVNGHAGVTMEALDALGEYLGLRLVAVKPASKPKPKRRRKEK